MRRAGYTCQVVERFCSFSKRRIDLFGFIDILCVGKGRIIGVQATSGGHVANRIAKIHQEPKAQEFIDAGGIILVMGWRTLVARKKDGSKAARPKWKPKVIRVRSIPLEPGSV
jgi:hypothetical protein